MEDILKAAGVTDVYACGIATDVCVGNKRTSSRFRKHTKTLKYDSNKNQLTQQHSGIEQLLVEFSGLSWNLQLFLRN